MKIEIDDYLARQRESDSRKVEAFLGLVVMPMICLAGLAGSMAVIAAGAFMSYLVARNLDDDIVGIPAMVGSTGLCVTGCALSLLFVILTFEVVREGIEDLRA